MSRLARVTLSAAALCFLSAGAMTGLVGCGTQTARICSFDEAGQFCKKLDSEIYGLYLDIKDNVFGIYHDPKAVTWKIYGE